MSQTPEGARSSRRKGYYARQIEFEAKKQGLTVEEYGVYKGSEGTVVKHIHSAGGLLFLAISITAVCLFVLTTSAIALSTSSDINWGQMVIGLLVACSLPPTAWYYYRKERKAERLRQAAGKTIQLPTRRSSIRD
jgi:hypothetical protein